MFSPKKPSSNVCGTPRSDVTAEYIASTTLSSSGSSVDSSVPVDLGGSTFSSRISLGFSNPGSVVASESSSPSSL
jgi:hypothetical protein